MKTIVFGNKKGGVGKTTIGKGVGEYIALALGKRVLYIDLDLQCNLSCRIIPMINKTPNTRGVDWIPPVHPEYDEIKEDLKDDPVLKNWNGRGSSADIYKYGWTAPYPTENPLIDIIPAHSKDLELIELQESSQVKKMIIDVFVDFINLYKESNEYDYCIIDTSPKTGPIVTSAMHASDYIIIPCVLEKMSVEGIRGHISTIYSVNQYRPSGNKLKIAAFIINKFMSSWPVHKKNLDKLKQNKDTQPLLLETKMRNLQGYLLSTENNGEYEDDTELLIVDQQSFEDDTENQLAEAVETEEDSSQYDNVKSIFDLPNSNNAKKEFLSVCEEVMERLK